MLDGNGVRERNREVRGGDRWLYRLPSVFEALKRQPFAVEVALSEGVRLENVPFAWKAGRPEELA